MSMTNVTLCFSETELDNIDEANINIDGFTPFHNHRKKITRKSGGIATFVKTDLVQSAKILSFSDNDYILWLKLDAEIPGYEPIIGAVYVPHPDSPYSTGHEFVLILRHLTDIHVEHCDSKICIIGDMNALTGTLPDFLETDEHLFKAYITVITNSL